ncbi:hypothetical protein CDAR_43601 [Caerostris darwini]|uniref:Uncharacterized protein n=1 Tax=Caerostris darwini TaxID=1538125 RepID=A0AAV4WI34_9ARAC|nr:hypothetical protein CDAR_43601 [Caerostris darwini]
MITTTWSLRPTHSGAGRLLEIRMKFISASHYALETMDGEIIPPYICTHPSGKSASENKNRQDIAFVGNAIKMQFPPERQFHKDLRTKRLYFLSNILRLCYAVIQKSKCILYRKINFVSNF